MQLPDCHQHGFTPQQFFFKMEEDLNELQYVSKSGVGSELTAQRQECSGNFCSFFLFRFF